MQHGGNIYQFARRLGCLPEQVVDFSANINPEPALDWRAISDISLAAYAEPDYPLLKQAIQSRYAYPKQVDIEVFNGASAAIFALLRYLQPKDLVLYTPIYAEYSKVAEALGCQIITIDRFSAFTADVPENSTIIFVNPATPDGSLYELSTLLVHWQAANCHIVIDESFLDFCPAESIIAQINSINRLYLIKSLSKFYGCAGIRIGFIVANIAAINALKRFEPAWKLSSFDMAYMQLALANTEFINQTRQLTAIRRDSLYQILECSGLFSKIYPGQANFLLAKLVDGINGQRLQALLMPAKLLIRVCDNFTGLDDRYVRFAVKDEQALAQLAFALNTINI